MKRTIEIDDTLDEIIADAKDSLKEEYESFKELNPGQEWEPHDAIFEIADGATPVYYSEIDGLWYLYGDEFEQAYEDAGIGDGKEDNYKQVAIFCYIEQELWDYHAELIAEDEDDE